MSIYYPPDQTEAQRAEEIRKFKFVCPEYFDTPENLAVLKQYLSASSLPILADTLCAGFLLNRNNLAKKPNKLRIDDVNLPGRTGKMTVIEKREDEQKAEQAREDRKSSINKATRQRERRESEIRIGQHQEYTNGKVNHAKTQTARQGMLAELDRTNPKEQ
jgi:hypothetical protein